MFEIKVDKYESFPPSLRFQKIAEDLRRETASLGLDPCALPERIGACDLRLVKVEEDGIVYSVTKTTLSNSKKIEGAI